MTFPSAVLGLGAIGQEYDYDEVGGSKVLTHASGYANHPSFDLVAGVDPDCKRRKKFEKKFKRPSFQSVDELFKNCSPEVLSICTPTPLHFSVFKEALSCSPKAVVCEKPLAQTPGEGKEMNRLAKTSDCILLVNYMRRFEPGVAELKERIKKNEIGKIYKGILWYTQGINHNGSHLIDLLTFLFGDINEIDLLDKGRTIEREDPEPDLKIRFGDLTAYFLSGRSENFPLIEMELMGERGNIRYLQSGNRIELRNICLDPLFPDYGALEKDGQIIATDLQHYQLHILNGLEKAIRTGAPVNSSGESALKTMQIVKKITTMLDEKK